MISGAALACSSWMEASRSEKRQQKQPPATSTRGSACSPASAVSTRLLLWSFITTPTRWPCLANRPAARSSSVVLPAPRNPPTKIKRVAIMCLFFLLAPLALTPCPYPVATGEGRHLLRMPQCTTRPRECLLLFACRSRRRGGG